MHTYAPKNQTRHSQLTATSSSKRASTDRVAAELIDNRPETVGQIALHASANRSPQITQLRAVQEMMNPSVQRQQNKTGLPDDLKAGVESLSNMSMDDVNVHYNSSKPAALQALAYTQGTDIHVGPGQEKHLNHEAWHVAQQKQGRVRPTMQLGGTAINDDAGLEREADAMGRKAHQLRQITNYETPNLQETTPLARQTAQRNVIQRTVINGINVINDRGYPKWEQNGKTYHMTMLSVDDMHVTEEYSRNHYHFKVDAGNVTSKRPKKSEVGGHFKDHHTLDQLPDSAVSDFVKNYIIAIMGV